MDKDIFSNEEKSNDNAFILGVLGLGVHDCEEQEKLLQIAKQCAFSKGIKQGIGGAVIGGVIGAEVAGVGAVPGAVAGALAGLYNGTKSCMDAQTTQEVRIFASALCRAVK